MYPKAQFLDQFCLTFFSKIFFSLFRKRPFNTLCSFAKTFREIVRILQSECETAINWLYSNKMIVNTDKFQLILLDKCRSDKTNIEVEETKKSDLLSQ